MRENETEIGMNEQLNTNRTVLDYKNILFIILNINGLNTPIKKVSLKLQRQVQN